MILQKKTKQKLLIAIGVTVLLALLMLFALSGDNWTLLKNLLKKDFSNEELKEQLSGFGWRGYIVISVLATLQVVCAFLPAEPVQILAGITYSFPVGLLLCMIGVFTGNTIIYLLQKLFGDRLRGFFVRKLRLDIEKISNSSKVTLLVFILYFLPAIPYGMICFLAASVGMRYRRFIIVTLLGALPSVCIGVGLGYMTIATGWVISVCVFSVFLLTIVLLAWKKNELFTKINNYADRHKKIPSNKVRPVNSFLLNLLYCAGRLYMFICGVRIKTVNKVGRPEQPSIILCNHGSFIDFVYAAALLRKYKPHFIVARLYFYNRTLGWALREVGAFPKSMFAMDMENAKNCLTVLKNNEILAMMPEARLSTAGRFEDIQDSTHSFIKKSGVNVYTIKISGDYLADPKWGKGFRRGAVVEAELELLYTAQQVKEMPLEDVRKGVEQRLFYDEFQWLEQNPKIRYRSKRMAEGLENILAVCPRCKEKHTITTKKDKVFCQHCGYLTSLDQRYNFTEDVGFQNLGQWYQWQMKLLEKEIANNPDYTLSAKVELRLPGTGKGLTRHGGSGVCTLNKDGLTYAGTKDGEMVELHFSLQRIYRLLFGAGENFEIYDGTQILYFVPEEKRSAVDWYMTSMLLHDKTAK